MPVLNVISHSHLERFDHIWMPVWAESNYVLESYIKPGINRYLFFDHNGDYGSLELIPYDFNNTPINSEFPFNHFLELKNKKVIEIEKLAIKKEARGSMRRLLELFTFLTVNAVEKQHDYYIALLNPDLYKTMVWRFKIPIRRLVLMGYEDLMYYPVIIDIEAVKNSKFGQRMLSNMSKLHAVTT